MDPLIKSDRISQSAPAPNGSVAFDPYRTLDKWIKQSLANDFEPRMIEKYLAGRGQPKAARLRPQ